jgi:hypothetical protein
VSPAGFSDFFDEEHVMSIVAFAFAFVAVIGGGLEAAAPGPDTSAEIIALERKVLDGWVQGNPEPALAVSDTEITYFHVMSEKRLDGFAAVKALVDPYRGRPLYDGYDMLEPKVQVAGEVAVLTYILVQRRGLVTNRWNSTQVYQRKAGGWRLIHSHWSQNAPNIGG